MHLFRLSSLSSLLVWGIAAGCSAQGPLETTSPPQESESADASAAGGGAEEVGGTDLSGSSSDGDVASNAGSPDDESAEDALDLCEGRCFEAFERAEQACDGDAACLELARERLESCLNECSQSVSEPVSPIDGCYQRCENLDEALQQECESIDDPERAEACFEEAMYEVDGCYERCDDGGHGGGWGDGPGDGGCQEECEDLLEVAQQECAEADDPEACFEAFREEIGACLDDCRDEPRPEPCHESCHELLAEAERVCAEAEDPEACLEELGPEIEACFERCGDHGLPPPPHPDDCFAECESIRMEAEAVCPESADPEACFDGYMQETEACFEGCHDFEPEPWPYPEPVSCEEGCDYYAGESYALCMEFVGDAAACEAESQADLDMCLDHCSLNEPDEDSTCSETDEPLTWAAGSDWSHAAEAFSYCTEMDHGCEGVTTGFVQYNSDGSWSLDCFCDCEQTEPVDCPEVTLAPCPEGAEPDWVEDARGCAFPICVQQ